MTDAQRQFHDRIAKEVSPALAAWLKGQFESGHSLSLVKHRLRSAVNLIEAERADG